MSEFSVGDIDSSIELSPLRARFGARMRICIHCGNKARREVIDCEKPFKSIKKVYRYCCPICKKETSPFTQISYEDNEKRLSIIYNRLLQYAKPEQIKIVWIDSDNKILYLAPNIENLQKIMFFVTIGQRRICDTVQLYKKVSRIL